MAPNLSAVTYINNHFTNVLAGIVYKVATVTSTTTLTGASVTCFLQPNAASQPAHAQGAGNVPLKVTKDATNTYSLYMELAADLTQGGDFDIILQNGSGSTNVTTATSSANIVEIHAGFTMQVQKKRQLVANGPFQGENLFPTGTEAAPVPFVFYTNWDAVSGEMCRVKLSGGKAPYTCHLLDEHIAGQNAHKFSVTAAAEANEFKISRLDQNEAIPAGWTFTLVAQDSAGRVENQTFKAYIPQAPTFTLAKAASATATTDQDISPNPAVWALGGDALFTLTVSGSSYAWDEGAVAVSATGNAAQSFVRTKAGDVLTVSNGNAATDSQRVGTTSLVYTETFGGISTAFDLLKTNNAVFLASAVTFTNLTLTDMGQLGHYIVMSNLAAGFESAANNAAVAKVLRSQVTSMQVRWSTDNGLGASGAFAVVTSGAALTNYNGAITTGEGNSTGPDGTLAVAPALPAGATLGANGETLTLNVAITDASGYSLNTNITVLAFNDMSLTVGAGGLPTYLNRTLNETVNIDISGYFAGGAPPYSITGASANSNDLAAIPVAGAASVSITGMTLVVTDAVGNTITVGSGSDSVSAIPAAKYMPQSGYEQADTGAANGQTRVATWSPATVLSQPGNLTATAAKTQADNVGDVPNVGSVQGTWNDVSQQAAGAWGNSQLALTLSQQYPNLHWVFEDYPLVPWWVHSYYNGVSGGVNKAWVATFGTYTTTQGVVTTAGTNNSGPVITGPAFAAAAAGYTIAVRQNSSASDWYYGAYAGGGANEFQIEWLSIGAPTWWNANAPATDTALEFYMWAPTASNAGDGAIDYTISNVQTSQQLLNTNISYTSHTTLLESTPWWGKRDHALNLSNQYQGVVFVYSVTNTGDINVTWQGASSVVSPGNQYNYAVTGQLQSPSAGTVNGVPVITGPNFSAAGAGSTIAVRQNSSASDWYYGTYAGGGANEFQIQWSAGAPTWWNGNAPAEDAALDLYMWTSTTSAVVPATAQAAFQANTFSYARLPVSVGAAFTGGFPLESGASFQRAYSVKAGLKYAATDNTAAQVAARELAAAEGSRKITLSGVSGSVDASDVLGHSYTYTIAITPFSYSANNDGRYMQRAFTVDNSVTFADLKWIFDGTTNVTGQSGNVAANAVTALINDWVNSSIIVSGWTDGDAANARSFWGNGNAGVSLGVSGTGNMRLSAVNGLVAAAANSYLAGAVNPSADIRLRAASDIGTEATEVLGTYNGNGGSSMDDVIVQITSTVTGTPGYDNNDIAFAGADDASAPGFVLRLDLENLTPGGSQSKYMQMVLLSLGKVETSALAFNLAETYADSVSLVGAQTLNGAVTNLDWKLYQRKAADSATDPAAWTTLLSGTNQTLAQINAALVGLPQRQWSGPMASATVGTFTASIWYYYKLALRNTAETQMYTESDWFSVAPGLSEPMALASSAVEASFNDVVLASGSASGRRAAAAMDHSKVALLQRAAVGGTGAWAFSKVAESAL